MGISPEHNAAECKCSYKNPITSWFVRFVINTSFYRIIMLLQLQELTIAFMAIDLTLQKQPCWY